MRIISGQRRGHKFEGPKGSGTRPTRELVREALFNILGESVQDLLVIDLFAGTGALGLEALSRGAARAVFVESNRENVALIRRNIATLRYEDRARVYLTDAYRWARSYTAIDDEPVVVLLDPPYQDFANRPRRVNQLLADLVEKLPSGSLIAVETGELRSEDFLPDHAGWDIRRYGGTRVAIRSVSDGLDAKPSTPEPMPDEEARHGRG